VKKIGFLSAVALIVIAAASGLSPRTPGVGGGGDPFVYLSTFGDGGTVSPSSTFIFSPTVELTATPYLGYEFVSWDCSGGTYSSTNNPTTLTFDSFTDVGDDVSCEAEFVQLPSFVSFTMGSATGGSATPATGRIDNATVQLEATPDTGYEFVSWSCSGGTPDSTTTSPTTLTFSPFTYEGTPAGCTPTFAELSSYVDFTMNSATGGSATPSTGRIETAAVELEATPDTGYEFVSWSCSGGTPDSTTTSPTTFTFSPFTYEGSLAECTPTFAELPSYVDFTMNSATGGSATPSTGRIETAAVELEATPDTGYEFVSWSCSGGTPDSSTTSPTTLSFDLFTPEGSAAGCTPTFRLAPSSYTVEGYRQPVDTGRTLNTVKAGSVIPLKFVVRDGSTLMTDPTKVEVKVTGISCLATGTVTTDEIEFTVAGSTALRWDGTQFIHNWKIPNLKNMCYRVSHTAGPTLPVTPTETNTVTAVFKTR
jgi:hypothetical protein